MFPFPPCFEAVRFSGGLKAPGGSYTGVGEVNILRCVIKDCPSEIRTEALLSPEAAYLCKHHFKVRKSRCPICGSRCCQSCEPGDAELLFQRHQFDTRFDRLRESLGDWAYRILPAPRNK